MKSSGCRARSRHLRHGIPPMSQSEEDEEPGHWSRRRAAGHDVGATPWSPKCPFWCANVQWRSTVSCYPGDDDRDRRRRSVRASPDAPTRDGDVVAKTRTEDAATSRARSSCADGEALPRCGGGARGRTRRARVTTRGDCEGVAHDTHLIPTTSQEERPRPDRQHRDDRVGGLERAVAAAKRLCRPARSEKSQPGAEETSTRRRSGSASAAAARLRAVGNASRMASSSVPVAARDDE